MMQIRKVSIQLVSPARGEPTYYSNVKGEKKVSIQLVSPARGELDIRQLKTILFGEFPFNWFPLREGNKAERI